MKYIVKVMRWDENAPTEGLTFAQKEHAHSIFNALFDVAVHNADDIRAVALVAHDGTDPEGQIIKWTFF